MSPNEDTAGIMQAWGLSSGDSERAIDELRERLIEGVPMSLIRTILAPVIDEVYHDGREDGYDEGWNDAIEEARQEPRM